MDENQVKSIANIPRGNERVLLVDDEEAITNMLAQMLTRLGYQVSPRNSSIDAFVLFRHEPDSFDLVITDMTMPNMAGDELAQKILALRPEMPIVLCTGFSEKISPEKADIIGIKGILMKPVVRSDLANLIREVLDNTQ